MSKSWVSAVVVTVVLVAVFIGVRAIPSVKCGFLHYEEVVREDGTVELCAVSEAGFVDLSVVTPPVRVQLDSMDVWQANEPYEGLLHLETLTGKVLYPQDLAITHTEKLHLMIINKSLSDYHHIHPRPVEGTEFWEFSFVPLTSEEYVLFADFVPNQTRRQVIGREYILPSDLVSKTVWNFDENVKKGEFLISLEQPSSIQRNKPADLFLQIKTLDGSPVSLEKVMDAYGHLVAFQEGLQGMGHIHPVPSGEEDSVSPRLAFSFNTPLSGNYRLWAQFKVNGMEKFVPFDLQVN